MLWGLASAPSPSLSANTCWEDSFLSLGPRCPRVKQEAGLAFKTSYPANSYISFKALFTCPFSQGRLAVLRVFVVPQHRICCVSRTFMGWQADSPSAHLQVQKPFID